MPYSYTVANSLHARYKKMGETMNVICTCPQAGTVVSYRCSRSFFPRTIVAASIAAGVLCGCATQGETGAAVGALMGAVIGKAVGGDRGAVLGAALGASVGFSIGKNMDEADRKKLAEARAQAARANVTQTFYSPSVKANVVVEPSRTYVSTKKQELFFDKDMQVVPMTVLVSSAETAYVDTPIYLSPDYNRTPKLLVVKGSELRRIALVDGTDWFVVGQGDYGMGYVHKDYFDEKIVAATAAARAKEDQAKLAQLSPQKPIKKSPPTKTTKVTKPAKADPVATSPVVASSMLDSAAKNLPPAEHFSTPKTNASDFAASASAGASKADAVKQGNKAFLTQAKVVGASTQCRDLVTTLLQDSKTVASEKSTTCSTTKGWV